MTDKIQQSSKTLAVRIENQFTEEDYEEDDTLQTREVSSPEAKDVIWSVEIKPPRNNYGWVNWHADYNCCTVTCRLKRVLTMVRADYSIYLIGRDGEHEEVTSCRDWNFIKPSDGGEERRVSIAEERRWASKFSQLYCDQASSDCIIQVGNTTLPVHKFSLMAHSPVFRVMFTSPMAEESKSGVVEISDFHPEPVRAMIRYCYEGHIDAATMNGEWGEEVFQLADKYDIDQLKAHIEEHFVERKLCVGNVLKMALLADSHPAPKLMQACVKLFARERKTISGSVDWEELKTVRPELAIYLAEEAFVKAKLSVGNVVMMARIADTHSALKLKKACVKLLYEKRRTIFRSADWMELERVKPELAAVLRKEVEALSKTRR